ncbi:MAG: serine/threonine protein kinase, partial [Myxococcales bacterium]|nr:serine/threonine protein kinase [Myxococcales bacterium]
MSSDHSGRVLHGTYHLVRKIGEGSMGSVYEARHSRLPKSFAVKMIAGEAAKKREALSRFRREAEITSRLGHPNIVEVIDFNETEQGEPYLVMELLAGEDLASYIRRIGAFNVAQAEPIMAQITSALDAAHKGGVVHRDLKPHNIFLAGEELRVKVVDFGISKIQGQSSSLTRDESIIGTPHYMAPEQVAGDATKVDWRADIYAIGAILYEMLCGKPPYFGAPLLSVLYKVVHEQPTRLSEVRPGLPPALDEIIARAMARDRTRRYERARDLMHDLRVLIAGTSRDGLTPVDTEPTSLSTPAYPLDVFASGDSRPDRTGPHTGPVRAAPQLAPAAATLPPPGITEQPPLEYQVTAVQRHPSLRLPAAESTLGSTEPPLLAGRGDTSATLGPMDEPAKPISTLTHSSGELRQLIVDAPPERRRRGLVVGLLATLLLCVGGGVAIFMWVHDGGDGTTTPTTSVRGDGARALGTGAGTSVGSGTSAAIGTSAGTGVGSGTSVETGTGTVAGTGTGTGTGTGASAGSATAAVVGKPRKPRARARHRRRRHRVHRRRKTKPPRDLRPATVKIVTKCKGMFWQNTALSVDGKRYKAGTWFQLAPGRHR